MSGDVQPRKRKDKKRKKDELGIEEPRGTAAALGEGDVFMHSQSEHGTGGHWCAKIIFFSLLAILITLIGLIILENRGLSELEANSVETRYSGVLEGWLEDAPDDDHHDEHTLELNHHDDDDGHDEPAGDDHIDEEDEHDATEQDEHSDEEENENDEDHHLEEDDDQNDDDDNALSNEDDEENNSEIEDDDDEQEENNDSEEQNLDDDEDEDEEPQQDEEDDDVKGYQEDDDDDNDGDPQEIDENDFDSNENNENDDENNSNEIEKYESDENVEENENNDNEDEEEHEEEEEDEHEESEIEKLEKEASDEDLEPVSTELPALPEEEDDDDKDEGQSDEKDQDDEEDDSGNEDEAEEDEEFLEVDDADEPPVEKITVPAGEPFLEVEEDVSSEQPPDTLEEEEEYEKRQEELRKQEEQASHMWLKLGVGAALLVATHAVVRRATREREAPEREETASRENTPPVGRRLTLIPEETSIPVRKVEEVARPVIEKVVEKVAPVAKSIPIRKQESEEEEEEPQLSEDEEEIVVTKPTDDKELYSEEEVEDIIEEEEEEEEVPPTRELPKLAPTMTKKPEPESEPEEDEDPEDVEIIGDEQLEEELEEEGDEEEISDVDDAELLRRLEAKYGKLPEPERPGRQKDGGNSVDDLWPGEPADAYWRQQLDSAEQDLRQGSWTAAGARAASPSLRGSARALYVAARALDAEAEARRDNKLLTRAIAAYLEVLKMHERLNDRRLLEVAKRALDRIQFRGTYLSAEPVHRLLIRRFPNEPAYRNNLTISFLMANRVDLAETALKETLALWPNDRVALAHYGFVLKTKHKKYEEAAEAFKKALEGDAGAANEPRFYYHYGDSLLLLGRVDEANEVHKRGAELGHFLSASQRSLYNVDRLKSTPWWDVERTPYLRLAKALEDNWREILKEGEAAKASYELEREGLKERGEWSQLDLFVRGRELPACARAPVTCRIVKSEPAAAGCRRGQVKFSLMAPGTHVRAHVGPTNCRLRMHLGLSNTKDTYIRVDKEIRQWQTGKVLVFDDSFEHEVWHNGSAARLVLIADVWHPALTRAERAQLPAI